MTSRRRGVPGIEIPQLPDPGPASDSQLLVSSSLCLNFRALSCVLRPSPALPDSREGRGEAPKARKPGGRVHRSEFLITSSVSLWHMRVQMQVTTDVPWPSMVTHRLFCLVTTALQQSPLKPHNATG